MRYSYDCVCTFVALPAIPQGPPSSFQMMGLDIMVTDDLQVKFLEANNYPLWPKGTDALNKLTLRMGVCHVQA